VIAIAIWLVVSWVTLTLDPASQAERIAAALAGVSNMRLTRANLDDAGDVIETPEELAAAAAVSMGAPVTVDEYALARMCATECVSDIRGGSDADKIARIWVALNDAAKNNGGDIVQCLTGGKGFGREGPRKYASGRTDPTDYHLALVRGCRSGEIADPTGGATHFLDKYGFATDHIYDPDKYAAAVAQWQSYGWRKLMTIGRGLEIWT
jgi:hypothetical protein